MRAQLAAEQHAKRVRAARVGSSHTAAVEIAAAKAREREAAAKALVRKRTPVCAPAVRVFACPPAASLLASCSIELGGDAENPPCARLVIQGKFFNVSGTDEEAGARAALFSRHPVMPTWPSDHSWFFVKVDVESAWLIDQYGGASDISPEDYFAADA